MIKGWAQNTIIVAIIGSQVKIILNYIASLPAMVPRTIHEDKKKLRVPDEAKLRTLIQ